MALPVFASIEIAFRWRPVYAKLNSQLDRYQQVVEPLRRLAIYGIPSIIGIFGGASAASRWQTVLEYFNRTSFGIKRSAVPPRHLVLRLRPAVLARRGRVRLRRHHHRVHRGARDQLPVRRDPAQRPRAADLAHRAHPDRDHGRHLHRRAGDQRLARPVRDADESERRIPGDRCRLHRGQRDDSGDGDPRGDRGPRRHPVLRDRGHRSLASAHHRHGAAPRVRDHHRRHLPGDRGALHRAAERARHSRRRTSSATSTRPEPRTASRTSRPCPTTRRRPPRPAPCRRMRRRPRASASSTPTWCRSRSRQLEQFKQFYQFEDHLDVDRYTIDGKSQDTVIAARELSQSRPRGGADLVQRHDRLHPRLRRRRRLRQRARERRASPKFLESGIPSTGKLGNYQPRIYFGENSPTYSIVGGAEG